MKFSYKYIFLLHLHYSPITQSFLFPIPTVNTSFLKERDAVLTLGNLENQAHGSAFCHWGG